MALKEGDKAPLFCLPGDITDEFCMKNRKGKWTVVYFYPKDNTSGCTLEALDFTCLAEKFKGMGAEVIGISKDTLKSHANFREKHNLGITLLSDETKDVMKSYNAWGRKKMYGKEVEGVIRSTFIIDSELKIKHSWYSVKTKGHAEKVLEKLSELIK